MSLDAMGAFLGVMGAFMGAFLEAMGTFLWEHYKTGDSVLGKCWWNSKQWIYSARLGIWQVVNLRGVIGD